MEKRTQMRLAKLSSVTLALTMAVAELGSQTMTWAKTTGSADVHTPTQVKQMAKYTTPVTITLGIANGSTITFLKGQSYDRNDVYDAYLKDMGIQLKNGWVVSSNSYKDKVNLSIASGNIPDLMLVPTVEQLKQLVDAGLVTDLTPYFQHDLTSTSKAFFTEREQMASATFGGKLMAIPFTNSPYNSANLLYIRRDWMKKLGLAAPKSMLDVQKIAAAFTKAHLGGKGLSYGLTATTDLNSSALGLQGFFNGYHAYPQIWLKNASGQLAYGSVQPQMKTALAALQRMYKAGQIDKEFAVRDANAETQLIANNEVGMAYGYFWLPSWPLKQAALVNNKISQDWASYVLPSADNKPAKSEVPVGVNGYYVISKNCKNPEAVFELLNKWALIQPSPITSPYQVYLEGVTPANVDNSNDNYWQLNPFNFVPPGLTDPGPIIAAIKNHNPSKLKNPADQQVYKESEKYLHGDGTYWNTYAKEGPNGTHLIQWQMLQKGQYQMDAFYGPPTPTMTKQWGNLESLLSQGFVQIITGKQPISYFDTLVNQWKAIGGQQVTQEINAWNAQASKQKVPVY